MAKRKIFRKLANLFGAAGYIALSLQWLWLTVTVVWPAVSNDAVTEFLIPQQSIDRTTPTAVDISMPSYVEIALVIVSIIFAIGVILYAVYAVPRAISKSGHAAINKAAKIAVQRTTHHQSVKPKRRQLLTARYVWILKSLAVFIPLALLLIPPASSLNLSHQVVAVAGIFLAGLSTVSFFMQILIAYLAKLPYKSLW